MSDLTLHRETYERVSSRSLAKLNALYLTHFPDISARLLRRIGRELGSIDPEHFAPRPPDDHRWLACVPFELRATEVTFCFPEHMVTEAPTAPILLVRYGALEQECSDRLVASFTQHLERALQVPEKQEMFPQWFWVLLGLAGFALLALAMVQP